MKQLAKTFPPFVDAYHEYDEPISLQKFKKDMLLNCLEWKEEAIANLFLEHAIHETADLKETPIYIGWWGDKRYGVFLEVDKDYPYSPQLRMYNYPDEWDAT